MAIVKHYVPAQRISDSVYGVYELVSNTFYPNIGTGTMTGGTAISTHSLPAAYQELTYIEADGDCWIDTNYIPTYNTWCKADFQFLTVNSSGSDTLCGAYSQASGALDYKIGMSSTQSGGTKFTLTYWQYGEQTFKTGLNVNQRYVTKGIATGEIAPWYSRIYVDNILETNKVVNSDNAHEVCERSLYLFATHYYSGTLARYRSNARLYDLVLGEGYDTQHLNYNGNWVEDLYYNGNHVDGLVYNGNTVY